MKKLFLCGDDSWKNFVSQPNAFFTKITEGFLSLDPERIVLVRLEILKNEDVQGLISIYSNHSKDKFEYLIPPEDARNLLENVAIKPTLIKDRYCIATSNQQYAFVYQREEDKQNWNFDIYHGENEGLILNEVYLQSKNDDLIPMPWVGVEVTGENRYNLENLSLSPFNSWSDYRLKNAINMESPIIPKI